MYVKAPVALMKLENMRIVKEMRNSVNRRVNCETANITKTVNAATRQIEDIDIYPGPLRTGESAGDIASDGGSQTGESGCSTEGAGGISGSAGGKIRCKPQVT